MLTRLFHSTCYGFGTRLGPAACVLALCGVLWTVDSKQTQLRRFGDDQEYLTMTTSLARHRSADFRRDDDRQTLSVLPLSWSRSLRRKFDPQPAPVGYYPSLDGRFYGYHFFTYSLLVTPMRLLLHGRSDESRAHQYTNLLCFAAALCSLLWIAPKPRQFWTLLPLVFASPILWFTRYAATETFVYSFCVIALSAYLSGRMLLAILFSAIAATQYQPLVFIPLLMFSSLVHRVWMVRAEYSRGRLVGRLALGALCAGLIFVPGAFYLHHFGTPSVIAREGFARTRFMSLARFAWMFVDLNGGMLIYTPGLLLMSIVASAWAIERALRDRELWGIAMLLCALATLFASTCQRNWNQQTFGVSRYVLYSMPAFFLFIGFELARHRTKARTLGLLAGATLALQLASQSYFGFFRYQGGDAAHHSKVARYVLEHWPALYSPPAETFCERTVKSCLIDLDTAEPMPRFLPAIWRDSHGVAHKILAQRCDVDRILSAANWSEQERERIEAAAAKCRGIGTFYIDL
ncbi:MAG TPA: hypothetical protein VGI70_02865 [Polyangiales bacterium]